jgi:hypothetical protein
VQAGKISISGGTVILTGTGSITFFVQEEFKMSGGASFKFRKKRLNQ